MEFTKKKATLTNGEKYAYLDYGKGEKTLILVHGNMSSSVHFLPLINKLENNYRVIAPDLRGFGDSTYNKKITSLKELAIDLKQFMDALKLESAHLAGWSTGAGVILEFANLYPNSTLSLILIEGTSHKGYPIFKKDESMNVMLGIPYESMEEMANDPIQVAPVVQALKIGNREFMKWVWDKTIYVRNKPSDEENEIYITETLKQRNLVEIDWALANINMSNTKSFYREGDDTIKNVKAKTLIIWSKEDVVVPYYLVEENYNALKEVAKLIIYEQGGHSPLVDNLDQLTQDIIEFIK